MYRTQGKEENTNQKSDNRKQNTNTKVRIEKKRGVKCELIKESENIFCCWSQIILQSSPWKF